MARNMNYFSARVLNIGEKSLLLLINHQRVRLPLSRIEVESGIEVDDEIDVGVPDWLAEERDLI